MSNVSLVCCLPSEQELAQDLRKKTLFELLSQDAAAVCFRSNAARFLEKSRPSDSIRISNASPPTISEEGQAHGEARWSRQLYYTTEKRLNTTDTNLYLRHC